MDNYTSIFENTTEAKALATYRWALIMNLQILMPASFSFFGIFGNLMIIYIYCFKNIAVKVMSYPFVMLAVFDLMACMSQSSKLCIFLFSSYTSLSWGLYGILYNLLHNGNILSIYTLIIITVIRSIAVVFPLKAKSIISLNVVVSIHVISCLLLYTLYGIYAICVFLYVTSEYQDVKAYWLMNLLYSNIFPYLFTSPLIILTVGTFVLKRELTISDQLRQQQGREDSSSTRKIVKTLIVANLIYLITNFPNAINNILSTIIVDTDSLNRAITQRRLDYNPAFINRMMVISLDFLLGLNNIVNFYIYLIFNKQFRNKFFKICKLVK